MVSTEAGRAHELFKRQAFGFQDRAFFKLRVYALHEARFSFVGELLRTQLLEEPALIQ